MEAHKSIRRQDNCGQGVSMLAYGQTLPYPLGLLDERHQKACLNPVPSPFTAQQEPYLEVLKAYQRADNA